MRRRSFDSRRAEVDGLVRRFHRGRLDATRLQAAAICGHGAAIQAHRKLGLPPWTTARAARMLGVSESRLRRWVRAGCPASRRGRRLAFEPARVIDWYVGHRGNLTRQPATATARALHDVEPELGTRVCAAALGVSLRWTRARTQVDAVRAIDRCVDVPGADAERAARESVARLTGTDERRDRDGNHLFEPDLAAREVLRAAAEPRDRDLLCRALHRCVQLLQHSSLPFEDVTDVEAELCRAIREQVLPWALGYRPRLLPPFRGRARWRVWVERGQSHGGLYELEQSIHFHVLDWATKQVVATFEGMEEASLSTDGGGWTDWHRTGVDAVEISRDGRSVVVRSGTKTERVALPVHHERRH